MAFVKGDPRINRNGRPKNAEPDLLRQALSKEGAKRGIDFWEKVAEYAFRDKNVMIAVLKKFVPDMTMMELEGKLEGELAKVVVIVKEKELNADQSNTGRLPASVLVEPK